MQPAKAWMIGDTVEKNKRIFKIPVYQRNYDWSHIQCEKLYNDIIDAFLTQKKHFTGTIVYIIGERSSSSLTEDLVIDGQQRITTILLLLKALLDLAVETGDSVQSELSDLLFNRHCAEEYKLKLKPVKADDRQFRALMQDRKELFDSNSHVIRNYFLFRKLISASLEKGIFLGDVLEGMKKLEIVEIVLDKAQGDDPQVIFESINSTGLELTLADKIRNFVLMDDENQDELFERYWVSLEEMIGSDLLADYFITFLDYKLPDSVSRDNAYDKFVKYFREHHLTHRDVLQELEKYAKYYAAFAGRKSIYGSSINEVLHDYRALAQTTLYIFLFDLFSDFEEGKLGEEELVKILRFLRSYSLRRIICEHPSNSLRGLYKTLYSRLFKNAREPVPYYGIIYTFFKTTQTKDRLVSDEEFYDSLLHKKLFPKKKACKFLLTALENEESNEKLLTEPLTIEHVLPQKENALIWKREVGPDYDRVFGTYLHTLGNLTITGYNSELGTRPFSEKKRMIQELSKANRLNRMILSEERWNEAAIVNRAKALAGKALELFAIEEVPLLQTSENSPEAQVFSLYDRNLVTGTTPLSYTFCGELVSVKSYSAMLTSLIHTLYDLSPAVMEKLAQEKYRLTSSDRIYLSTSSADMRRAKEIDNSGIFYEVNLSAAFILLFIESLIEAYDIDTDEFEFQCKAT